MRHQPQHILDGQELEMTTGLDTREVNGKEVIEDAEGIQSRQSKDSWIEGPSRDNKPEDLIES